MIGIVLHHVTTKGEDPVSVRHRGGGFG